MSASATEAQVITAQPVLNSTDAPDMNEGFSQFNSLTNCDPEQQKQVKEQRRHVNNTVWCCMTCDDCCDCAECCVDCCEDTVSPELDNDGTGCGDCFECCSDGAGCCDD